MADFNLGDIVTLETHSYTSTLKDIIFAGEPQFVPPLMVVIEKILDTKTQYDEKSGDEISFKGNSQCKCLWYSSKLHQFEEAWVSSKMLKNIYQTANISLYEIGKKEILNKLVIFKTSEIELLKQKSSISIESNLSNTVKDKIIINPLLSFVAPVMQIIQIIESKGNDKEGIYDQTTGKPKRYNSKWLAKCKWYNPNEKFTERLLPLECLILLPQISVTFLDEIDDKIKNSGYYRTEKSLIQPQNLLYVNGSYYLKAFDYLQNKTVNIKIENQDSFMDLPSYVVSKAPVFDFSSGEELPENYFVSQMETSIEVALNGKYYIRINYTNRLGVNSYRTLKEIEIITIKEGEKNISYLKGYCLNKKEIRYFRLDRIQEIQVLNYKY